MSDRCCIQITNQKGHISYNGQGIRHKDYTEHLHYKQAVRFAPTMVA